MRTLPPDPLKSPERTRRIAGLRQLHQNRLHMFDALFAKRAQIIVGRTRQCHIRVYDPTVSRRHCSILRMEDDRYMLRPLGSAKVFISPAGRYGTPRGIAWTTVDIGIYIHLGNAILIPVDANGEAPVIAWRYSEYIRDNLQLYGSANGAHQHAGIPRRVLRKYDDRNTGDENR